MSSVILIGMPAAGKSAAGKLLAKLLGYPFYDGDDLIRAQTGEPLSATIGKLGPEGFLAIEERALCGIPSGNAVVATGGSAVYSEKAMAHLRSLGKTVYLKISAQEAERRVPDFSARGVVMRGEIATLRELYAERAPLYEKYADYTVDCTGKSPAQIAEEIWGL